jgi:hypothetical protein
MSGVTELVHEGRFVRLEFSDGVCINWATFRGADGRMVTAADQVKRRADGFRTKLEALAAMLVPLLQEFAAAQGGKLVPYEERSGRCIEMDLGKASSLSRRVASLRMQAYMPPDLSAAQWARVLACTDKIWDDAPKPVNRDPGVPPWQVLPHLGPRSSAWRMGEGAKVMARWSKAYAKMFSDMCDDYQAKYPAPFYWFWIYWGPNEFRTSFIPILAIITLPWRWWDHRAHRRRAGAPPAS